MTNSAELESKDAVSISSNILELVKRLHNEELKFLSSSEVSLEYRNKSSLYQLSIVVQQAVICYSNAIDSLNLQIRATRTEIMDRVANF